MWNPEKVEPPRAVMTDFLTVTCRRYGPFQSPSALVSAFESGRSLATGRFSSHEVIRRSLVTRKQAFSALKETLREASRQGYGRTLADDLVLHSEKLILQTSIRVSSACCSSEQHLGRKERDCECYTWFWRGFLTGITIEFALDLMGGRMLGMQGPANKRNARSPGDEELLRRILEARAKTHLSLVRSFNKIVVIVQGEHCK